MKGKWENWSLENKIKKVFGNPDGEELLEFLMETFVLRRSWEEGKFDTTAFAEGQKDVVLMFIQLLEQNQGAGDK